jgi:hypothetical protein
MSLLECDDVFFDIQTPKSTSNLLYSYSVWCLTQFYPEEKGLTCPAETSVLIEQLRGLICQKTVILVVMVKNKDES